MLDIYKEIFVFVF